MAICGAGFFGAARVAVDQRLDKKAGQGPRAKPGAEKGRAHTVACCLKAIFRYEFNSAQARQTVRWRRFRGREFAPESRAKASGQAGAFASGRR